MRKGFYVWGYQFVLALAVFGCSVASLIGAIVEQRIDLVVSGLVIAFFGLLPYYGYKETKKEYEDGKYNE